MAKTFDVKCWTLAKSFLEDAYGKQPPPEKIIDALASEIQSTIEDFIQDLKDRA